MTPRVTIGIPTYGGGAQVQAALESLLTQSVRDVAFAVVDDASPDGTVTTLRRLADGDPRVRLHLSAERIGMVRNWNRAYHEAIRSAPEAEYFAWASDHDVWEPTWLEQLIAALDSAPEAVLAYPRTDRFSGSEHHLRGSDWTFDTRGVSDPSARVRRAARRMVAGDMVYGLYRVASLPPGDIFPTVVYPDRLLLARLAARGEFVQVPDVLWRRRMGLPSTPRRQRSTLFGDRAPMHARLPWWLVHAVRLRPCVGNRLAVSYAAAGAAVAARSMPGRLRRGAKRTP